MATISSTIKLIEKVTQPVDRTIKVVDKLIDTMERLSSSSGAENMEQDFQDARRGIHLAGEELDAFNRELGETGSSSAPEKIKSGFGGISKAIVVVNQGLQLMQQLWSKITGIMERSDERINVDARLNLINDGLRTQAQLEAQVMDVANRTRSSYEATGDLIAQMGRQDYFKGNNNLAMGFAETINKAFVVSGTGPQSAQNALLQLNQAIASGVLRGEEFNSVMENASVLADMMASSLNVNKGELRKMAAEGKLTTDVVVAAIMNQSGAITEEFDKMPVTYGQAMTVMGNHWSQFLDRMSQPGQAIDRLLQKIQQLVAWLDTADGQMLFNGIATGAGMVVDALIWIAELAGSVYTFFTDNWSAAAPILGGIATALGLIAAALLVYKTVTLIAAAAQWVMNSAMLANPITWIVLAVIVLIAIIVALTLWIMDLWKTNIDFKVGVIKIWNSILDFFGQVPIFFMTVGYGIADAFSYAKTMVLLVLQTMVNDAIGIINTLINMVNQIPGVSIEAIQEVTFGTETAIEEAAKRQERAASLQGAKDAAAAKSAERNAKLEADAAQWRAEAADNERKAAEQNASDSGSDWAWENKEVELGGGKIDKVGSVDKIGEEIDLSNQTLAYMMDIAERAALTRLDDLNAGVALSLDESTAKLSKQDAELMKSAAGRSTNIYYLDFNGSVKNTVDARKGEDWESIKRKAMEESQQQIEIGLDGVEAVVVG